MHVKNPGSLEEQVVLNPGDHFVTNKKIVLSTLLGSCVSACLYDPVHRIMGMNHFLLSSKRYKKDGPVVLSDAGRYGTHAMEIVINGMLKLGAARKYLKAKAFGGGNVLGDNNHSNNLFCVGEVNVRFIKEFLDNENIPLVTSDLGGNIGRVIRFDGSDYSVYVKKIKRTETMSVATRERDFRNRQIKEQGVKKPEIELW